MTTKKTTSVQLPRPTYELLRLVALRRAAGDGGRISISRVVTEIVESRRETLEKEIKET